MSNRSYSLRQLGLSARSHVKAASQPPECFGCVHNHLDRVRTTRPQSGGFDDFLGFSDRHSFNSTSGLKNVPLPQKTGSVIGPANPHVSSIPPLVIDRKVGRPASLTVTALTGRAGTGSPRGRVRGKVNSYRTQAQKVVLH